MAGCFDAGSKMTDLYNRVAAKDLRARLGGDAPLVMQGPMGSLLMSEPGGADIPSAAWNIAERQTVERLHELYVAAGAEILVTNTFQASAPALERDRVRQTVAEVNRAAVDCARAAQGSALLGSIGPCGLAWMLEDSPDYRAARAAYREQAAALLTAGVDGLLLETFTSIRDLTPALAGVLNAADGMPVLVSFAIDDEGNLLGDGLNIEAAVMHVEREADGALDAVGVNCCPIEGATAAVPRVASATDLPIMVRPNAGTPGMGEDGGPVWSEDPGAFATACREWIAAGARLVGGCCGTGPRTVCALSDVIASALSIVGR